MPEKTIPITKVQIGHIVGPGGSTIKKIQQESGANVEIDNAGPSVKISADEQSQVDAAEAAVKEIVANQENPDYEGPEGARLRKEANELGDKRSKLFDEATAKRNAGDHEAANKLAAEAKQAGEEMESRNHEAAAAIANYNNEGKGKGENYFDMHGLREAEAVEMLKIRTAVLEGKPAGTVTDFEVIPGAGHHSAPGAQKLKSATEAYFKEKGYSFEDASAGSIVVKVPGGGDATADEYPTEDPATTAPATDEYPTEDPAPADNSRAVAENAAEDVAPAVVASDDEYPTEEPANAGDEYPTEDNAQVRGGAAQVAEEDEAAHQQQEEETAPGSKVFVAMPAEVRERRSQRRGRSREPISSTRGTVGGAAAAPHANEERAEDADEQSSSRVFVRMPAEVRERRSRSREGRSARPSVGPSVAARSAPEDHSPTATAADDTDADTNPAKDADTYPTEDGTAPIATAEDSADRSVEDPATAAEAAEANEVEAGTPAQARAASDAAEEAEARSPEELGDSHDEREGGGANEPENHEPAAAENEEASFEELDTPTGVKKEDSKEDSKEDAKEDEKKDDEKKDKKKKDKGGCCATM